MGMIEDEIRHSRYCAESWELAVGGAGRSGVNPRLTVLMREEADWYRQHADGLEKWHETSGAWLSGARSRSLAAAAVSRLLTVMRPLASLRTGHQELARSHEGSR